MEAWSDAGPPGAGGDHISFEFHAEVPHLSDELEGELRSEAMDRMQALAADHNDVVGASVVVEDLAPHETSYVYRARVVAYVRPENVVAEKKGGSIQGTLRQALSAVERQVRERREKLRERWKQP